MCVGGEGGRGGEGKEERGRDKDERRIEEAEEGKSFNARHSDTTYVIHMLTTWHKTVKALVSTLVKPHLHILTQVSLIQIWT